MATKDAIVHQKNDEIEALKKEKDYLMNSTDNMSTWTKLKTTKKKRLKKKSKIYKPAK